MSTDKDVKGTGADSSSGWRDKLDKLKTDVKGAWRRTASKVTSIGTATSLSIKPRPLEGPPEVVSLQVGRQLWRHAPRQLRLELWMSALHTKVGREAAEKYAALVGQEIDLEAATDINKDIPRSFPNSRQFHSEDGQASLRSVLRAYAAYDPEVGYCQGMNFLTGLLLMFLPSEESAFAALVVLMEERALRKFYSRNMSLLQVQLWQLGKLISPKLNAHLESCGVVPMLYGASWLMTAFSADFPASFSARIMDVMLSDRCNFALLKVAVTILHRTERHLRGMADLEDVLSYLKLEVPGWDEHLLDEILTEAFGKPWTLRQLDVLNCTEGAETVAQAMDRVLGSGDSQAMGVDIDGDGCAEDEDEDADECDDPLGGSFDGVGVAGGSSAEELPWTDGDDPAVPSHMPTFRAASGPGSFPILLPPPCGSSSFNSPPNNLSPRSVGVPTTPAFPAGVLLPAALPPAIAGDDCASGSRSSSLMQAALRAAVTRRTTATWHSDGGSAGGAAASSERAWAIPQQPCAVLAEFRRTHEAQCLQLQLVEDHNMVPHVASRRHSCTSHRLALAAEPSGLPAAAGNTEPDLPSWHTARFATFQSSQQPRPLPSDVVDRGTKVCVVQGGSSSPNTWTAAHTHAQHMDAGAAGAGSTDRLPGVGGAAGAGSPPGCAEGPPHGAETLPSPFMKQTRSSVATITSDVALSASGLPVDAACVRAASASNGVPPHGHCVLPVGSPCISAAPTPHGLLLSSSPFAAPPRLDCGAWPLQDLGSVLSSSSPSAYLPFTAVPASPATHSASGAGRGAAAAPPAAPPHALVGCDGGGGDGVVDLAGDILRAMGDMDVRQGYGRFGSIRQDRHGNGIAAKDRDCDSGRRCSQNELEEGDGEGLGSCTGADGDDERLEHPSSSAWSSEVQSQAASRLASRPMSRMSMDRGDTLLGSSHHCAPLPHAALQLHRSGSLHLPPLACELEGAAARWPGPAAHGAATAAAPQAELDDAVATVSKSPGAELTRGLGLAGGGMEGPEGAASPAIASWALKRPQVYIDGIAMFDPKSILSPDAEVRPMLSVSGHSDVFSREGTGAGHSMFASLPCSFASGKSGLGLFAAEVRRAVAMASLISDEVPGELFDTAGSEGTLSHAQPNSLVGRVGQMSHPEDAAGGESGTASMAHGPALGPCLSRSHPPLPPSASLVEWPPFEPCSCDGSAAACLLEGTRLSYPGGCTCGPSRCGAPIIARAEPELSRHSNDSDGHQLACAVAGHHSGPMLPPLAEGPEEAVLSEARAGAPSPYDCNDDAWTLLRSSTGGTSRLPGLASIRQGLHQEG